MASEEYCFQNNIDGLRCSVLLVYCQKLKASGAALGRSGLPGDVILRS